jgi:uncharacterized repeat protein (TIGR03803 family)
MPQTPALTRRADSTSFKILYRFRAGDSDGANPQSDLIHVGGKLYGTTVADGPRYYYCSPYTSCGTVFSVTLGGSEKVLHTFDTRGDGHNPVSGLIDAGGTLYGTTSGGGSASCYGGYYGLCGTVFSITPSGAEKLLHGFSGLPDGEHPIAGLVDVQRTL